jgi:hypothetical protein
MLAQCATNRGWPLFPLSAKCFEFGALLVGQHSAADHECIILIIEPGPGDIIASYDWQG